MSFPRKLFLIPFSKCGGSYKTIIFWPCKVIVSSANTILCPHYYICYIIITKYYYEIIYMLHYKYETLLHFYLPNCSPVFKQLFLVSSNNCFSAATFDDPWSHTVATIINPAFVTSVTISFMQRINCVVLV